MEQVRPPWEWGDVTTAQYETDKSRRIVAASFQPGDECTMRVRVLDIPEAVYISDYPVRIDAVKQGEEGATEIGIVMLDPRREDWSPDPFDVTVPPDNMLYQLVFNEGRGRRGGRPKEKIEVGYFLPKE